MDYGQRDTLFVPFFNVPAATITGLSRLVAHDRRGGDPLHHAHAAGGDGYVVELGEPWADYPGESIEADTLRMNAWIESRIAEMPEQYYWVHKRFKTRPPGEQRFYK
jgi:KDO2-lipid IV(A) lauroyltransferase